MTVIAITNRKGGTGKTTTAVNLAACLAEQKKNVLLIDTDAQANATVSLGVSTAGDDAGTMAVITTERQIEGETRPSSMECLEVLPAGSALAAIDMTLGEDDAKVSILRERLKGDEHDYVIIDTPPAMGVLAMSALVAAESVIVPLICDYLSLEGLREFGNNLNKVRDKLNPGMQLSGLLKTMYDGRTLLARQVSDELDRHFGSKVFKTVIPRNVRLGEAPSHGKPVILYDARCSGAIAYRELAGEVLARTS